jgi:hypothetical protein
LADPTDEDVVTTAHVLLPKVRALQSWIVGMGGGPVAWWSVVLFGAAGGAIVEVVNLWGDLAAWQQARRDARRHRKRRLPSWTLYFDPWPDALVACTRLLLGALAALVFRSEITGQLVAVAVGASAPALLGQLGAARSIRGAVGQSELDTASLGSLERAVPDPITNPSIDNLRQRKPSE